MTVSQSLLAAEKYTAGGTPGVKSLSYLGEYGIPSPATAQVDISPFWGADRNALKRWYYVDVIFTPRVATECSIKMEYWVDGEEFDKYEVIIDQDAAAYQGYNRQRVRVNLGFWGHELNLRFSTSGTGDRNWWRIHSIIYGWKREGSFSQ